MREVAMLTSVILMAGTLYAPAGEGAQASSAATRTLAITSRGAKTGYQMQFLRLHAGEGTDSVSGSNDTTQHLYLGANSDPDFFGVRFYETDGSTPIVHRRMFCVPGQYADFILKLDLPAAGQTKQVVVNYAASGRTTESSDAALENIHFYGWVRQGASRNGLLRDQWGVEMTTLAEKGKVRAWFRGSAGGGRGDYAGQGRMRYGESADGVTWADLGEATGLGPYEGQPYVYKDENGLYHMMYNDNEQDGVHDYRYLTSPSGSNRTWSIVSESAFRPDGGPGNLCFWKEGGTWHLLYEWMQNDKWVTSYAKGPALDRLTKYNNGAPVLSGAGMVGGIEVHKVGPTYYVFGHAAEGSGNLPTSAVLYKSTDLTTLSRVGWAMRRYYHATYAAQVADPTVKEFNGKTFLWYESQPDQHDANVPYLSAAIWDQPLARMLDPVVTTAVQDDLEAEGWVFDPGCGENNTHTLGTVFRKLSDKPSPISPNCVVVRTEPGRFLKIRKAIGPLAAENVFEFYARAEQTNKRFECFRIDKDGANGILAGVYFDADGSIKYYRGQSSVAAQSYSAGAYYRFQVIQKTGGYDLKIDGKLMAKDIPYPASFSMPTHFYVGQDSGATGYISGLYTRLYSDPDTEPVWGWNRDEPAIPGTVTNSRSGTIRADELEQIFDHPPAAAKPRAMWMWMGCHLSQAGITRDL
ncbi:MAG: hypothetical protein WCQ21_09810, partial [Verrucomicrobiota bacterium]